MQDPLAQLLENIRACRLCADELPHAPRPVLQASSTARLRIVSQAPGRKVHQSGVPWTDASGDRLRRWLGLSPAQFYDPSKVAIVPMGFCYPGKALSGDHPPRPRCAPLWHPQLNAGLGDVRLTLLIGQYAQAHYLGRDRKPTLTDTVRAWREYLPMGWLPLPHPSPRNQPWFAKHPWFEAELVPEVQNTIRDMDF